jgi:hypothetical protein
MKCGFENHKSLIPNPFTPFFFSFSARGPSLSFLYRGQHSSLWPNSSLGPFSPAGPAPLKPSSFFFSAQPTLSFSFLAQLQQAADPFNQMLAQLTSPLFLVTDSCGPHVDAAPTSNPSSASHTAARPAISPRPHAPRLQLTQSRARGAPTATFPSISFSSSSISPPSLPL